MCPSSSTQTQILQPAAQHGKCVRYVRLAPRRSMLDVGRSDAVATHGVMTPVAQGALRAYMWQPACRCTQRLLTDEGKQTLHTLTCMAVTVTCNSTCSCTTFTMHVLIRHDSHEWVRPQCKRQRACG